MNHGTINLRYDSTLEELEVWGEAPFGSTIANLKIYDSADPGPGGATVYTDSDAIMNGSGNDSRYAFNQSTSDPVDVSGMTAVYDVEVEFEMADAGSYKVSAVFDSVLVLDLLSRMDDAESRLADVNSALVVMTGNIEDLNVEIQLINTEITLIKSDIATLKCVVSNLGSRVIALETQMTTVIATLERMSHGTLSIVWDLDEQNGFLRVKGEVPLGTDHLTIHIRDENRVSYMEITGLTPEADNSYRHDITNVLDWDWMLYDIAVSFYDDSDDVIGQWVNEQFYALEIMRIDSEIAALWEATGDNADAIEALEIRLVELEEDVEELEERVSKLEEDVDDLYNKVKRLRSWIMHLKSIIKVMNHATINMFYNETNQKLNVWGEAAYGTEGIFGLDDVGIVLMPTDMSGIDYMDSGDITGANNTYQFTSLNGNPVDTSGLDAKSYNVFVYMHSDFRPHHAPPIYVVGTIFDALAIKDLQERLTELEDKVEMLDDGTIEFHYDSVDKEVTIFGEAPTTAKCINIWALTASGSLVGYAKTCVEQDTSGEDYSVTMNTSDWPQESINVYTEFYEKSKSFWFFSVCKSEIGTVKDTFDSLLSEDLFGFRDITVSSYVTSYYVNEISVPITFALKPDRGGFFGGSMYKIEYEINGSGNWNQLVGLSWFDEGVKTYKTGNIELDSTGLKRIKLRAKRFSFFSSAVDYTSYIFRINHVDIKDSLEAATTIVKPISNSDMTLAWPYGSIADDVFWTQSGAVPLIGYLNTNTINDRDYCEVFLIDSEGDPVQLANYFMSNVTDGNWVCDAHTNGFNTNIAKEGFASWGNINHTEGKYTTLRIYNSVEAHQDTSDDVNIGIDNTSPVIHSVTPNVKQIMFGVYRWDANITDNLSGINNVNFSLIEKPGNEYCVDSNCHIGTGTPPIWAIDMTDPNGVMFDINTNMFYYDLNTLMFPDGDYNVMFEAWDIAGNHDFNMIDPPIDNTPPVIHSINVTLNPIIRGNSFLVDANVTDNKSGVDSVLATISLGAFSKTLVLNKNGRIYSGMFDTNSEWSIGVYTLIIDANDLVNNQSTDSIDVNIFEDYSFNLSLSESTVIKGADVIITGQLLSDIGRQVGDANVFVSSSFFGPIMVTTDVNGNFAQVFSTTTAGTFDITANFNDGNTGYADSKPLAVNNPAAPPAPEPPPVVGPGLSGGGGGGNYGDRACSWFPGFICGDDEVCEGDTWTANDADVCCITECVAAPVGTTGGDEETDACDGVSCTDSNPCTKDSCLSGLCKHESLSGINCYNSGRLGVCEEGSCKIIVSTDGGTGDATGPVLPLEEPPAITPPTGFFGLGSGIDLAAGFGVIVLFLGGVLYFFFFRKK